MGRRTARLGEIRLRVGGLGTYARVGGLGCDGLPAVLVHGLGLSGHSLEPLAVRLAAQRPTYVPDLPGYGRSDKPAAPLDVPGLADALAAWMAAAGTGPAALLGNSMGCQVIVDLALRYPSLADRLVLVGPSIDPAAPTVLGQAWRALADMPGEPLSFWPVLLGGYLTAGPLRTLQTLRMLLRDPLCDKLRRLTQPVLVVRGGRDPIAPQRWAEEVCRLAPHAELVVLPRAAHVAPFGAPDALTDAVAPFLAAGGLSAARCGPVAWSPAAPTAGRAPTTPS